MATALVFSNLSLFLFVQVSISERTFWQSVSYAAGVGAMMSANVFLVPMFAAEGAVVATMAAYMVVAATMFWAAQRHFRAHVDIVRLVLVLFAVLCVAVSARVLGEPRLGFPMDLLVKALLTLGVWGVLLSIIGVRDLQSIRVLWRRLIAVTQDEDGAEATDGS